VDAFHLSLDLFPYFSVPDDSHLVMSDVSLLSFNLSLLNTIVCNSHCFSTYGLFFSVVCSTTHDTFYVTRGKILMLY
jgi:hypothetical protein